MYARLGPAVAAGRAHDRGLTRRGPRATGSWTSCAPSKGRTTRSAPTTWPGGSPPSSCSTCSGTARMWRSRRSRPSARLLCTSSPAPFPPPSATAQRRPPWGGAVTQVASGGGGGRGRIVAVAAQPVLFALALAPRPRREPDAERPRDARCPPRVAATREPWARPALSTPSGQGCGRRPCLPARRRGSHEPGKSGESDGAARAGASPVRHRGGAPAALCACARRHCRRPPFRQ